jgi:S1-C subfamily serine protease
MFSGNSQCPWNGFFNPGVHGDDHEQSHLWTVEVPVTDEDQSTEPEHPARRDAESRGVRSPVANETESHETHVTPAVEATATAIATDATGPIAPKAGVPDGTDEIDATGPTWSATGTTPTSATAPAAGLPPAGAWPAPAPASPAPRARGGLRQFVVGVVVGGVVGALVAGGIVVATRDDGTSSTTRVVERPVVPAEDSRNAPVFAQPVDIQGVLQKVEPAVVAITTGDASDLFASGSGSGGAGTGFVVSPDGVIVTNNHVIEGAGDQIQASFTDGTKKKATVLGSDPSIDLAVIKVDGENLPTAKLGDSSALQVGDQVIAIGNALALDGGPSVTQGIVSAVNRQIQEQNGAALFNLIQTDAAINPGNSGGPLVNTSGEVVGINTAIADPNDAQNVGFAISISSVADAIEQLRVGKSVRIPYLGVYTETLNAAMAKELGSGVESGALVREVTGGSPADDAGIKKDDVIVQVGAEPVTSAEDVGTAVRQQKSGDVVSVTFDRDGRQQTAAVTLGVRPDSN